MEDNKEMWKNIYPWSSQPSLTLDPCQDRQTQHALKLQPGDSGHLARVTVTPPQAQDAVSTHISRHQLAARQSPYITR